MRLLEVFNIINEQEFLTEARCAIYNALKKHRPDLADEMERVGGNNMNASILFLQDNGLWDDTAHRLAKQIKDSRRQLNTTYPSQGIRADRQRHKKYRELWEESLNELMCYMVRLIKASSPITEAPLRDLDVSRMSKDPKVHPKHLGSAAYAKKLSQHMSHAPVPIDVYVVEFPFAKQEGGDTTATTFYTFSEPGQASYWQDMEERTEPEPVEEFGKLEPHQIKAAGLPAPRRDAISYYMIGRGMIGKMDMPLTPWMTAHRLGHAIFDEIGGVEKIVNVFLQKYIKEIPSVGTLNPATRGMSRDRFLDNAMTTRSARRKDIVDSDHTNEMFVQYLVTGRVTLNFQPEQLARELESEIQKFFDAKMREHVGDAFYAF